VIDVTTEPIEPDDVLGAVGGSEDGAALLFIGTVRDHNDGKAVEGLEYQAYPEMAVKELRVIVQEARSRFGVERVAVVHRIGRLDVGDIAVAVACSSPHRAETFDTGRYVMEEIKKRLPIWKKEGYLDGHADWVKGTQPPEPAARLEEAGVHDGEAPA
jgi:molybdopterin synthase catalytic subunit